MFGRIGVILFYFICIVSVIPEIISRESQIICIQQITFYHNTPTRLSAIVNNLRLLQVGVENIQPLKE